MFNINRVITILHEKFLKVYWIYKLGIGGFEKIIYWMTDWCSSIFLKADWGMLNMCSSNICDCGNAYRYVDT